jgi:hypothetical protein
MWSSPECSQVLQQTWLSGQRGGLDLCSKELDEFITKYLKARKSKGLASVQMQHQQQQQQQQSLLISKEALRRVTDKQLLQHELVEQMLQPAVQQDLACILNLFTMFQKKQEQARIAKIAADKAALPIAAHEAAIVSAVQHNRVVIIAGKRSKTSDKAPYMDNTCQTCTSCAIRLHLESAVLSVSLTRCSSNCHAL